MTSQPIDARNCHVRYCTLFDASYATRGLVMLDSLARESALPFHVTILAIDDLAEAILYSNIQPEWTIIRISSLKDPELSQLEEVRPRREFCWTAAPALLRHIVALAPANSLVGYVDADLMFFQDPFHLYNELGHDESILIHEHRFSFDRIDSESSSGRFNVGFIGIRVNDESNRCVERWRNQVIDCCELDPDRGHCGDQAYLNEWPSLYPGLHILENLGAGVAPWNLRAYRVGGKPNHPRVNGQLINFFHYHSFRSVAIEPWGFLMALPAYGYSFSPSVFLHIYRPYARRLRAWHLRLIEQGYAVTPNLVVKLREAIHGLFTFFYFPAF